MASGSVQSPADRLCHKDVGFSLRKRSASRTAIIYQICTALFIIIMFRGVLNSFFVGDDFGFLYGVKNSENLTTLVQGFISLYVRPLSTNWFVWVNWHIWGPNAFGFHLSQLLIHVITVLAFYRVIVLLTENQLSAFAGALVYGLSRLHLYTLPWVAGAIENLLCCFFVLTLLCYLEYVGSQKKRFFVLSLIFFACSLLSKEPAVVVPFILILYRISKWKRWQRGEIFYFTSMFSLLFCYFILRTSLAGTYPHWFAFSISSPLQVLSNGIEALFPYRDFGRFGVAQLAVVFVLIGVLITSNRIAKHSIDLLPIFAISAPTIVFPACIFAFVYLPTAMQPYYSTMSFLGFSLLAATAIGALQNMFSSYAAQSWQKVGRYFLYFVVFTYAGANALIITEEIEDGNSPALRLSEYSSTIFEHMEEMLATEAGHGWKTIVFKGVNFETYWTIAGGRMLDVMFPDRKLSSYFLLPTLEAGNNNGNLLTSYQRSRMIEPNDPILSRDDTVVLVQMNTPYFEREAYPAAQVLYTYGESIVFGRRGNYFEYQGEGWSQAEAGFTWTDGQNASLTIPLKKTESDIEMASMLMPFTIEGELDRQTVNIFVNGKLIGQWVAIKPKTNLWERIRNRVGRKRGFQKQTIMIPSSLLKDSSITIRFQMPDAVAPLKLGVSGDKRILGIAVRSIVLRKVDANST